MATVTEKTILGVSTPSDSRLREFPAAPRGAWKAVAWFGFALALIGFGQVLLYLYPSLGFGSPEWEFAVSAQVLGSLPFPTMGVVAMLAAALALGSRRGLIAMAVFLFLLGIATLVGLVLFWSVAPLALRNAPEIASATIRQTAARTTLSGIGFGLLFLVAAVLTVRHVKRSPRRSSHA